MAKHKRFLSNTGTAPRPADDDDIFQIVLVMIALSTCAVVAGAVFAALV